jgi:hypothetical protein
MRDAELQGYQCSVVRYTGTEGETGNIRKNYRKASVFGKHCAVVNTLAQCSVTYRYTYGHHEGICGSTRTTACIRNLGTRWKSVSSLTAGRFTPGSY